MGMNLHMRTPNQVVNELFKKSVRQTYLIRNYSGFIFGEEASGENCEFNQIERVYNIDLSPLKMLNHGGFGWAEVSVEEWKDWEIEKASTSIEKEKVLKEYAKKLKKAKINDEKEFKNNWIQTAKVKTTIKELISKTRIT